MWLQLGVALGFVLPPILVPNDGNKSHNMLNMFLGMACITSVLLVLIFAGKFSPNILPVKTAILDKYVHLLKRWYNFVPSVRII